MPPLGSAQLAAEAPWRAREILPTLDSCIRMQLASPSTSYLHFISLGIKIAAHTKIKMKTQIALQRCPSVSAPWPRSGRQCEALTYPHYGSHFLLLPSQREVLSWPLALQESPWAARQFRGHSALPEDPSLIPSAHTEQFTLPVTTVPGESDPSGLLRHLHLHTYTHNSNIFKTVILKSFLN